MEVSKDLRRLLASWRDWRAGSGFVASMANSARLL